MDDRTEGVLNELQALVAGAKAVPMSASCMINRAEALSLIGKARAALTDDVQEAHRVTATSLETLERAHAEAKQIVAAAEDRASYLSTQDPVFEDAQRKAAALEQKALADAEALRREADAYVDARIATFEASLHKTMAQVRTMRERLARRSSLDDDSTRALPKLEA
jgi:peptidoglycan hydrolase CwlO-like protein